MRKVAIVTDSTAFLDKETLQKYGIEVVPLYINFPDTVIEDGSIDNDVFLQKLKTSTTLPFTSQPAPGDFVKVFQPLLEEGNEVVAIFISSRMSGTVENARAAVKMLETDKISIVDSLTTSGGLGMLAIEAAKDAEKGKSCEEIVSRVERLKSNQRLLFIPDTLEYLRKGGRIGGAQAFLGTILQIKPILHFYEGKVEAFDKVRTMKKAMERIVQELPQSTEALYAAVLHAGAPKRAEKMIELVQEQLPGLDVQLFELSPVISTHVGPGVVSLAFMQDV